jgi:hypothetical protein
MVLLPAGFQRSIERKIWQSGIAYRLGIIVAMRQRPRIGESSALQATEIPKRRSMPVVAAPFNGCFPSS